MARAGADGRTVLAVRGAEGGVSSAGELNADLGVQV